MTTLDERPTGRRGGHGPAPPAAPRRGLFDTSPDRYKHWRLAVDGEVATLALDVAEDGGIVPGYELKMNSYDLGVDIELHDAVQRLRFEHPAARPSCHQRQGPHVLRRAPTSGCSRLAALLEVNFCSSPTSSQRHRGRLRRTPGLPVDRGV